ncbi:MAG: hypothetical protein JKY96_00430 [Phycisphaerales bacterium]|nr:hypothetical protein [Phycisphaerales bacterium]
MSNAGSISTSANATIGRLMQDNPASSSRVRFAKLPSASRDAVMLPTDSSGAIDFRKLFDEKTAPIESRRDMFTGTELDAGFIKDESAEGKVARARQAAEQLVASTLITPILKSLRDSNQAAEPFGPTDADKQFGSLLDTKLADQIVSASNFPLVDRIQRDMLKHSAYMNDATKAVNERSVPVNSKPLDLVG